MKKINVFSIALIAVAMMASCSTNDDVTNQQGGDPNMKANVTKVLRLSISGNNGASRASGAIAEGSEATVNNLVVAVYSNDDNKVEVSSTPSPAFVAGTFTTTIKYNTTKPTILVAANVPDDIFKTVSEEDGSISYMTKEEFMNKFISLDLTANDDGNAQVSTKLPMVGSTNTVTQVLDGESQPVENEYEASISLYRLVSRIKLNAIDVTGLPDGESFTVEEVFVRHAGTESLIFNSEIPAPADLTYFTLSKKATVKSFATGVTYEGMKDAVVKDYLLNSYASAAWSNDTPAYFYVFPNYNSTFDTRTQLVIKGTYSVTTTPDGGGDPVTTTETTYYPIEVNAAQVAGKVDYTGGSAEGAGTGNIEPNHQYTLSIALTGKGQTPEEFPTEPDPNGGQYNVRVTISVAEWAAEIVQRVTF